jgi:ribosomal protein L11 methyltransferase
VTPLYVVKIHHQDSFSHDELDRLALVEYGSLGKVDYNLDEASVDEILGKDAYCGGDIPEELLLRLEQEVSTSVVPSYFWEDKVDLEKFTAFLKSKSINFEIQEEEKQDWNESWRKSFQVIEVTEDLRVVPSWEASEDRSEDIYIYPGMGFGTGNHETTFLCLKIFSDIKPMLRNDLRCLDFGCGSGILGIASLKQIGAVVDFVDIDKDALDNCLLNLEHNKFQNYQSGHSLVLRERFKVTNPYPLVFANILENILELEYALIEGSVEEGGHLIVSGLLKGQEENITRVYRDFKCQTIEQKNDWVAIHFIKEA